MEQELDNQYIEEARKLGLGDYIQEQTIDITPQETNQEEEEDDEFDFFDYDMFTTPSSRRNFKNYEEDESFDNVLQNSKSVTTPETASSLYNKLLKQGESPIVAAGIVGNAIAESGGNHKAIGDNGTSYGLFQHHNDRKHQLQTFLKRYKGDEVNGQLEFTLNELKEKYPSTYKAMQKAQSPEEAAYIFARDFEKPAKINSERLSHAKNVYKTFQFGGFNNNQTIDFNPNSFKMYNGYTPSTNVPYSRGLNSDLGMLYYDARPNDSTIPYSQNKTFDSFKNLDPTGTSQIISAIDSKGADFLNGIDTIYKGYKKYKDVIGKVTDSAVTGITSILNQKNQERDYMNQLEKLYANTPFDELPLTTQLRNKSAL